MATVEDVEAIIAGLPAVTQGQRFGHRTWFVGGKGFAWIRPFSKADVKRFGTETPPDGPILAVAVADLGEKELVLATASKAVFNIAHFQDYPAVLIQLSAVAEEELRQLVSDAWLACAPGQVAEEYLARP